MSNCVTLTPAQTDFLLQTFPEFNPENDTVELAGSAASQRYFIRIRHQGISSILIVWDSRDEDWPRFLAIGHDRERTGMLLPAILAADPRHGLILEEDLGDETLKAFCNGSETGVDDVVAMYRRVLDALTVWQSPTVAAHPVIAARSLDHETFVWESSYFARYCVTAFCGCESLLNAGWEKECRALADECASLQQTAVHRDFQSENILIHNNTIRFVDFQGARLGPAEYDIASLLYDPYVERLDDTRRTGLFHYWLDKTGGAPSGDRKLMICATQRLMQALGAYANLSLYKGKKRYRSFIPVALHRLRNVAGGLEDFPELRNVVEGCCAAAQTVAP